MRVTPIVLCLWLVGCGSYFPPTATSRRVQPTELAGEWRYEPFATDGATVTLLLAADGTFTQTVQTGQATLTHAGQWHIDGSGVVFDGILTEFNGWQASGQTWTIVDRNESPAGFAIFGGTGDPDLWVVFDWIR